jgi:HEAT repeat protein
MSIKNFCFTFCLFLGMVFLDGLSHAAEPKSSSKETREKVLQLLSQFNWSEDAALRKKAEQELRDMGTNAMPYLVEAMGYRESTTDKWYSAIYQKCPPSIQKQMSQPEALEQLGRRANFVLTGSSKIKAVVPELMKLLTDDRKRVRYQALEVLSWGIEGNEHELLPTFVELMNDPNKSVRLAALRIVGKFTKFNLRAKQQVEKILEGDDELERVDAAGMLLWADRDHQAAMDKLVQSLESKDISIRLRAALLHRRYSQDMEKVLPVYIDALSSTNVLDRQTAIRGLTAYKTNSAIAVPKIISVLKNADGSYNSHAVKALEAIAPNMLKEIMKPTSKQP